ncbi:MAG: FG-GAP repeat protein [Planctomycetes bacterium]|nr:FG-GAP repeat protein [Planctomycetota bacterium]
MQIRSFGFEGSLAQAPAEACASREENEITYGWNSDLSEWYVNGSGGMEHGYTLLERPERGVDATSPLTIQLAVRGTLSPQLFQAGSGLLFMDDEGWSVLSYGGLHVFDSLGAPMESWFQLSDNGISIVVDESKAVYPLTIDPVVQEAYLKASNPDELDAFGSTVAISGNRAVAGAWREKSNATGIDGDGSDNSAMDAGAAYAFSRVGSTWVQDAYLKASNTEAHDYFGVSLAISGDLIVVGASEESSGSTGVNGNQQDNSAPDSGAVYVFENIAGAWQQIAYLKASNTGAGDRFGSAVAIQGERIVVGARGEGSSSVGVGGHQTNNLAGASGAAYVFERVPGVWTQVAYLKAHNTGGGDNFGSACSLSGDRILVGARLEDSTGTGIDGVDNNDVLDAGAAYAFVFSGGVWVQDAYIKASNPGTYDHFGQVLSISGDMAVVGTRQEDSDGLGTGANWDNDNASDSGAAYSYRVIAGSWEFTEMLKPLVAKRQHSFASSVSLVASRLVVGSSGDDIGVDDGFVGAIQNRASASGAVFVFDWDGTAWQQQGTIRASYQGSADGFGSSALATATHLIVGAPQEDSAIAGNPSDNSLRNSGAVYVFDLDAPSANYCGPAVQNLSGQSATISFSGSRTVASNNFALHAQGMTTRRLGYFLSSRTQNFVVEPGGAQGYLCLGGSTQILRHNRAHEIRMSGVTGSFSVPVDLTDMPGGGMVHAGETWNFQAWFRDQLWTGQLTTNFTDGLSVQFE